jgi:prepilin-type N-terminal cleavage/methylation domain-containing protein/prepilin-type processing-associated H-X9-DG protein
VSEAPRETDTKSRKAPQHAFTIVELLVVVAIIALLGVIQFPALANTKSKVERIHCSDNLKRIGVAFRTWAENHNGRMPMFYPHAPGGSWDGPVGVVASSPWTGGPNPNAYKGVYWMFMVMSNELTSPKILFCPGENSISHNASGSRITYAEVFGPEISNGTAGYQNDYNVSYFVGVDANNTQPNLLLAGDHNLGVGANQATRVGSFTAAGTNSFWTITAIGWQANNHYQQGNVLLADGSVQNLTTAQFRNSLNNSRDRGRSAGVFSLSPGSQGPGVNRLQFP